MSKHKRFIVEDECKKLITYAFAFCFAGLFLVHCSPKSEKHAKEFDRRAAETDYLTTRDEYIGKLHQRIDYAKGDSLRRAEEQCLLDLQERLHVILKDSNFSGNGDITIETFLSGIGMDLLDGLIFSKDSSTRIFHTTHYLFNEYFRGKEGKDFSGGLTAAHFEIIFTYAFPSEARVYNYSFLRLASPDSINAYGMVAQLGQGASTLPPQYLYVFVSMKSFIYMAEIDLKTPIRPMPQCELVIDSLLHPVNETPSYVDSSSIDDFSDPYRRYYNCYVHELKHDPQFAEIKQKMQSIADYLINPNSK